MKSTRNTYRKGNRKTTDNEKKNRSKLTYEINHDTIELLNVPFKCFFVYKLGTITQEKVARPIRSVKPLRKRREIVENEKKEARSFSAVGIRQVRVAYAM